MSDSPFVYSIDADDTIVEIGRNWGDFAGENGWERGVITERIVGKSLWDFIQGKETRYLYERLLQRVRSGLRSDPVPFRCDSPQMRRFLTLSLTPHPHGKIEITSAIRKEEPRERVRLLEKAVSRSDEMVTLCSMCKKIKIDDDNWVEIEDGLRELRLFESEAMPALTHGVCPVCYRSFMAQLEEE